MHPTLGSVGEHKTSSWRYRELGHRHFFLVMTSMSSPLFITLEQVWPMLIEIMAKETHYFLHTELFHWIQPGFLILFVCV